MRRTNIEVDQYDKEGNLIAHYESMLEATCVTGISGASIVKACRGINHTSGGYIWRYSDAEKAAAFPNQMPPVKKHIATPNQTINTSSGYGNSYQNLANAIIQSAASDYRTVLKIIKKRPDMRKICKLDELEAFFHSGWFSILTNLDGDYILNRIKKEVAEEDDD